MPKNTKLTKDLSTVKAVYRNLRSSPRKINDILRSIRGKKSWYCFKKFTIFRKKSFKRNFKNNQISSGKCRK